MKAYCGENAIKHVAGNKDGSADELHTVIKEATNKVRHNSYTIPKLINLHLRNTNVWILTEYEFEQVSFAICH